MGCICSKGVSANENVLTQRKKSSKQLFGASGRDDVTLELDICATTHAFKSHGYEENVTVSPLTLRPHTQTPGQIDSIQNTRTGLPSWPDSINEMFKVCKGGVFTLVLHKSVLLIEMYVWDSHMFEPRKTYSLSISLKDTHTGWHHQTFFRLPKSTDSSDDKIVGLFLDFLFEDDKIYPWINSFLNQRNFFPALGPTLGQAIKTKLTSAKNAGYLLEPTSFQASVSKLSSNASQFTREDLQRLLRDLPICKTVNGKNKNLHMKDLCMMASTTSLNLYKYKFEEKTPLEQEDILVYLYMNWQDLQQDSSVIEALKETKFVTSADGDLHKPKDLFDPGDSLLISVFSGEVLKFPGERFVSNRWLNILRKTGLQNTDDPDVVLKCARRIEFLGAESMKHAGLVDNISNTKTEVSVEIWSLAETFVKAITDKFSFLYDNNFGNVFGTIACIPAKKGFLSESGKKGVKRVLCSYNEAILLKHWPLAWTTAPVLCRESLVPPEYSWGALQLMSPPRFTIVIEHLQAEVPLESSLFNGEDASFEVLKYLDTIWSSLSSSDILELQQVAFIAADNGTRLVSSSSLFDRLPMNLSPLASKLPSRYLPFVKTLKQLGLQEMLSISSAMTILSSLRKSCCNHRLNPNELRAVIGILHFLCNEITEQQKSESDTSNWESNLVVPDNACRLTHSNLCVYIDSYGSKYVKYIDSSELRFVHQDVSDKLCLAFGIRKLSDVVVEEIDRIENLHTLEEIGPVSLATIRLKLLSRSFQVAVSSVVNNLSRITSGYKNPDFPTLQRSLKSIAERLQFVQCIYTRFWLLPKSLDITRVSKESVNPEWESVPFHRSLYYVDRSNTRMLIAEPPSYVSVLDLVAIVVSHVLGFQVPLPISSLFLCPQDSEPALVNILKLSCDTKVMDRGTGFLGRCILPEDAKKVQLHPYRTFYKGEIVAWKSQNGEKLKYGRVQEDVRPSTGKELNSVKIETFPGKTNTFLSSHVLWFGDIPCTYQFPTHGVLEESERVKLRNQGHAIKEREHGRVSAEEFVQAVGKMISGAGIIMDTEKQCLLQTTLSLQEQLNESQAALVLEQEKSEMAIKNVEAAKEALLCRICLTNEIYITLVPCGHVLCCPCSSDVSCCPICRVQLSKTMKLYRP